MTISENIFLLTKVKLNMPCNKVILTSKQLYQRLTKSLLVLACIMFFPMCNSLLCDLQEKNYEAVLPNTKVRVQCVMSKMVSIIKTFATVQKKFLPTNCKTSKKHDTNLLTNNIYIYIHIYL